MLSLFNIHLIVFWSARACFFAGLFILGVIRDVKATSLEGKSDPAAGTSFKFA